MGTQPAIRQGRVVGAPRPPSPPRQELDDVKQDEGGQHEHVERQHASSSDSSSSSSRHHPSPPRQEQDDAGRLERQRRWQREHLLADSSSSSSSNSSFERSPVRQGRTPKQDEGGQHEHVERQNVSSRSQGLAASAQRSNGQQRQKIARAVTDTSSASSGDDCPLGGHREELSQQQHTGNVERRGSTTSTDNASSTDARANVQRHWTSPPTRASSDQDNMSEATFSATDSTSNSSSHTISLGHVAARVAAIETFHLRGDIDNDGPADDSSDQADVSDGSI